MKTIIHTPSGDLSKSIDFYLKLNFKKLEHDQATFVSDGKVIIEINPDQFARAGIKIYKDDWDDEVQQLNTITLVHKIQDGFLIADPSNVWIYLIKRKPEKIFAEAGTSFSSLGNYAGVSLETTNISKSIALWEILGFKHANGKIEQGWVEYKNEEGFSISFMTPQSCPHLFFNPSLTYFNGGKNLPVIEKIREAGIPITQEITHFNNEGIVDNVIIRDPGGYGFFIFND